MRKFTRTGWGFAKKGTKLLRHWGTKGICHSEALAEESFLKGHKILRHYGTKVNLPLPTGEVDFVSERSEFTKSGEGTIVKMLNGAKKRSAFTLSEVLIVLAVLGVIAAMTIPDLIQDYREKALITALKKNYSIFEQAVEMAQVDNGFMTGWDIGTKNSSDGALKLYNILKPYLRTEKDCGTSTGCLADSYEALFNSSAVFYVYRGVHLAKGVLSSGASFAVQSSGTGCNPSGTKSCGSICVDVNGKAGPNKLGVDFFGFTIYNFGNNIGVVPNGKYQTSGCAYGNTGSENGLCCAWWALKHENMDYLRKAGKYTKY